MSHESTTLSFIIPEPFEKAIKLIRQVLREEELKIPMELNVSRRLRRELGIGLGECKVLCVDCPASVLEAMAVDRSAGLLLPLHVVVSGRNQWTQVHLPNPASIQGNSLAIGAKVSVSKLLARVTQALERVATREVFSQLAV